MKKLAAIDKHVHALDPNWPITATDTNAPTSPTIHVNPDFLRVSFGRSLYPPIIRIEIEFVLVVLLSFNVTWQNWTLAHFAPIFTFWNVYIHVSVYTTV